jgi:hypothetical protein
MPVDCCSELRSLACCLDRPIGAAHLLIVDPLCSRIHLDEGIPDNKVYEWSCVQLAKDEAERICGWVGEEDEAVPCEGFVEV